MNKLTILFLALFLGSLPMAMQADVLKEKKDRDDSRYLAGAVPQVDGKVVFSKEFQVPGKSQQEIFDILQKWMNKRLKENDNPTSRVVFADEKEGTIAGIGEEWLVFRSTALMLDRSLMNYQITADCRAGGCTVLLEKIRYEYRETENYKAEEWITDEVALNKTKTKLRKVMAKWRRKTVDMADDLFFDVAVAFGAPDTRAKAQKKKEEKTPTTLMAALSTVVIGKNGDIENDQKAEKSTSAGKEYEMVDLKQIPADVYALMSNCKLVVSIGEDEYNMTNMTANEGGALGKQSGKTVAYFTLSANQSHEVIDKADRYTLKLFKEGHNQPVAIIECKKLSVQAGNAGQPRTYVGEIVKLLLNK